MTLYIIDVIVKCSFHKATILEVYCFLHSSSDPEIASHKISSILIRHSLEVLSFESLILLITRERFCEARILSLPEKTCWASFQSLA